MILLVALAVSAVILAALLFGIARLTDDRPRYKRGAWGRRRRQVAEQKAVA